MVGKYVRYENNAAEALKAIRDQRKRDHGQRFGDSMLESTDPHNLRNIKGICLGENREDDEEKLVLPSHKHDLMSASLRFLSTDYFGADGFYTVRLALRYCRKLAGLPLGMENLSLLQWLHVRGCVSLEELPCNIGRLVDLRFLSLEECTNLKTLEATFHSLPSLVTLDLDYCSKLQAKWMDVFTEMKSLRVVYISECPLLIQRWQQLQQRTDLDIKSVKCIYQEEEEEENDNHDDDVKREEEEE